MRNITRTWFEVKVRCEKVQENGLVKKVTEQYVVDAMSFTEAESSIIAELEYYCSGEYDIQAIKRATYREIFFSDNSSDDRWFKAKLQFITIDEKTEKEKRTNVVYLVQAANIDVARNYIKEAMDSTMIDYDTVQLMETPFMDVLEHKIKNS